MQLWPMLNGNGSVAIGVLGDFCVHRDGQLVETRTRQVARVGALLAAHVGSTVTRDQLVEALWGDSPPETAANTLQVHISQLRSIVGRESILTTLDGYRLNIDGSHVDAEWFKNAVRAGLIALERGDNAEAQALLESALAVWRGMPYRQVEDSTIHAQREQLIELRESAIEASLTAALGLAATSDQLAEVIALAKGQIARQPLRERGYEVLIRALAADGRAAEALAGYADAERTFTNQAGVGPSPRLRVVADDIRALNQTEVTLKG